MTDGGMSLADGYSDSYLNGIIVGDPSEAAL